MLRIAGPLLVCALFAHADDSKTQVMAYLEKEARRVTDRAAAEIASRESWGRVRARRLEEMRDMLGLLPWPERTPLNLRITGTLDQGDYVVEKIVFESLPRVYVTGNLYLPKRRNGRVPAVVYVCGHARSPYGAKTQYQRHGISFAKNGYVAFILDPIQIAETFGLHHGSSFDMWDWYSRGYSPAGVETWNAMRAIDYLETRPEVDRDRIGMTGRSGGAAMSWFSAAVDPRIKVVAPVMGISTYAANVHENTQRLHCDCMFEVNALLHDMLHQGALIAPRPLLMAHGAKDRLFPVAGYSEFQERVGALFAAYGRPAPFRNIVVDTAHQDSDYLREQAILWFDRFLMRIPERPLDMSYTNAPDASLAVFPDGPPADARNHLVQEFFTTRPAPPAPARLDAWEARRRELLPLLRTKVFAALTREEAIPLRKIVRKPRSAEPAPALLYVASDGEDERAVWDRLADVNSRNRAVRMIVYPRGAGETPWEHSFWKDVMRNAMHIGQTVDSMRLGDVLAAFEALGPQPRVAPPRKKVAGQGISGALGLYAAILDERISQALLIDPPESHVAGPIFLNVLRYTDLPEAAALLAPRRLNFFARVPAAYDYTRRIYGLYGKADSLFRTLSIEAVVEGRYAHDFSSGL